MRNRIRKTEHGVDVVLDPNWLLNHKLYMPDGETVSKSNMTLGQAIEAIAYAHINAKMPESKDKCSVARIAFKNGRFYITFVESVDHL